jgi:hypothetical protein
MIAVLSFAHVRCLSLNTPLIAASENALTKHGAPNTLLVPPMPVHERVVEPLVIRRINRTFDGM